MITEEERCRKIFILPSWNGHTLILKIVLFLIILPLPWEVRFQKHWSFLSYRILRVLSCIPLLLLRSGKKENKWVDVLGCVRLFAKPWTIACQALLPMGLSQQEYLSGLQFLPPGLPFPPPRDLPDPKIKPESPVSPSQQAKPLGRLLSPINWILLLSLPLLPFIFLLQ